MSDIKWNYKREEAFSIIPEGTYRCRIAGAEKAVSQRGNDMLILTLEFDNKQPQLRHYIVFMDDKPEVTNRMLTQMCDSFDIEEGNFEVETYVGKVGACRIKHKEDPVYGTQARVSYFIDKSKQGDLPPWKGAATPFGFEEVSGDEDMPF